MRLVFSAALALLFTWEIARAAQPIPPPDSPERREMVARQILLDEAGFRPGKIDGLGGEFTDKATRRYQQAQGLAPDSPPPQGKADDAYTEYTITEEDASWVGPQEKTPAAQEKLKQMLYADYWELVAERFHCDLDFLRELNPDVPEAKPGVTLRAPNVKPFLIAEVAALEKERREAEKARKEEEKRQKEEKERLAQASPGESPTPTPEPTPTPTPPPPPKYRLVLLREERQLEVFEGDKLIASFPCTPGSRDVPVPEGTWMVKANILLPYYRWDKSVLESGVRSSESFNLPPGPNNPVGIVWMAINRPSVGMHGTPTPDQIGRNESHGCIRFSNWDAFTLSQILEPGVPLEVR